MDIPTKEPPAWKSRDAWLCLVALIGWDFLFLLWLNAAARLSPGFDHWWASSLGKGIVYLVQDGLWVLVTLWFSRVETFGDFLRPGGLRNGVTIFGWCAACLAIGVALVDGYGASKGLTASSKERLDAGFRLYSVAWFYFTLSAVLIAPFCEELATRGFLFCAFRGRYSFLVTTIIIICFSAYFHRSSVAQSVFTFCCLGSLWVLLCTVRERTGSLWDCLLCHGAYNLALVYFIPAVVALALFLPIALFPAFAKRGGGKFT